MQAVVKGLLPASLILPGWRQNSGPATQMPPFGVNLERGFSMLASRPSIPTTTATGTSHTCTPGCRCSERLSLEARRSYANTCRLKPKFRGGKIKVRTAYKERFKAMKDGTVKVFPPGFRHRRSRKSNARRLKLKQPQKMHQTYANTLKRMGFM
jgi:ribosomal protein L35